MHTKRRRVKISQFLQRISYIEIQGRRANDIKHSASWEATQVFLNLPFFLVQVLLFIYCDFRFLVLSVIYVFVVCLLQDARIQVVRRSRSNYVLHVTPQTRGSVDYPSTRGNLRVSSHETHTRAKMAT